MLVPIEPPWRLYSWVPCDVTAPAKFQRRMTPVQYLADGETFVVVASNAGAARAPAWYLNLQANPHAQIDVGGRSVEVRAQEAAGQERVELWRRLTAANRYLERAARKAGRDLPLMALVPSTPTRPGRAQTDRDDEP